jgi:integrase/recombinase XerD
MTDTTLIGPYLRRFLLEDVIADRNLSSDSQRSYRDAIVLLLRFVESRYGISPDRLAVETVNGRVVREFLVHLEKDRGNSESTRNQRLATLHSLYRFIARQAPEAVAVATEVQAVPFRKTSSEPVPYLEKPEMDAILSAQDQTTAQGRRDYSLLLFLYNTGARASEAAGLLRGALDLGPSPFVRLVGKGSKTRICPLWPYTAKVLGSLLGPRGIMTPDAPVFLNVRGQQITRFGIHTLVERSVARAAKAVPSLTEKQVSPHVVRHTVAVHLLRSGVDINTIRAWLGHVNLGTTNKYAEVDLEMKARALEACAIARELSKVSRDGKKTGRDLMPFLASLGKRWGTGRFM